MGKDSAKLFPSALALTALVLTTMIGCTFKGDGLNHSTHSTTANGGKSSDKYWVIKPDDMRIYPSTRFAKIDGELVLEARIEFLDEVDDPIKATGELSFELFNTNKINALRDAKLLFRWEKELLTKKQNIKYYDTVTRAYLFRLGVHRIPPKLTKVVLKVTYTPPTGKSLKTAAVIQTP